MSGALAAEVAPRSSGRPRATLYAYAPLLVAWGIAAAIVLGPTATLPGGSPAYVLAGAALVAVSLAVARAVGLDARALALRTAGPTALRGAVVGALVGTAGAAAGVAALRLIAPLIVGEAIEYAPLSAVSGAQLLWHISVLLPLAVVVPEEIAFRGVLLGGLAREHGSRAAVPLSALTFALWHGSVALQTVASTSVATAAPWSAVAAIGAFAVIAAGGLLLAAVRLRTGTLLATIALHWSFNAVVLAGLWMTRP